MVKTLYHRNVSGQVDVRLLGYASEGAVTYVLINRVYCPMVKRRSLGVESYIDYDGLLDLRISIRKFERY